MELIECSNCGTLNPDYDVNWLESEQRWVCYSCEEVAIDYALMESDIVDEFESCSEGCQYLYGYCIC